MFHLSAAMGVFFSFFFPLFLFFCVCVCVCVCVCILGRAGGEGEGWRRNKRQYCVANLSLWYRCCCAVQQSELDGSCVTHV